MPQLFNHTVQMQRTPQEFNHTVQMQRMPQEFNHTVQMQITSYSRWRDAYQMQSSASRRWDGSWIAFHNNGPTALLAGMRESQRAGGFQ